MHSDIVENAVELQEAVDSTAERLPRLSLRILEGFQSSWYRQQLRGHSLIEKFLLPSVQLHFENLLWLSICLYIYIFIYIYVYEDLYIITENRQVRRFPPDNFWMQIVSIKYPYYYVHPTSYVIWKHYCSGAYLPRYAGALVVNQPDVTSCKK